MSRKTTKTAPRASRRPSQSTRAMARSRVSVAKPAQRRKPEAEGATLGMNAKKTTQRQGFKTHEFIVYPAHGVGQIVSIEEQEVAGARLELFVINFVKDKMTLRVPTSKVASVGMRKLAETPMVKRALETLKGRARIKRTMWSRRAQEYEAKINSGDIVAIAEVVRDLYPVGNAAGTVLFRAAALRGRARPVVARSRRRAADHRNRSDQGDRGGPCQGPASRSEARSGRRSPWSRKKRLKASSKTNTSKGPASLPGLFHCGRVHWVRRNPLASVFCRQNSYG